MRFRVLLLLSACAFTRARAQAPGDSLYRLGLSEAVAGRYVTAKNAFEGAAAAGSAPGAQYNVAAMFSRLGQRDSAFTWLNQSVKLGFADTSLMRTDPDLAGIRGDARFAQAMKAATISLAPCMGDTLYHSLDFWLGEWNVTTEHGAPVGTSSVQSVAGGCGIYENWTGLRGGTGKSLSAYDATTRQWQQFYVAQVGVILPYTTGEQTGSSVVFHMAQTTTATGAPATARLTFTPMPNGVVRQHSELSTDGGSTWRTQYDFYYHRKP